jgi:glucose-6-phosphate isomerase
MTTLPDYSSHQPQVQWQRFCQMLWHHDDLGVWVDVSRMALNQAHLDALEPAFDQAFSAMQALESGAIANPDEGRQVGHYWLRTPELAPDPQAAAHIQAEVERIDTFGQQVIGGACPSPSGTPFTPMCSGSASAARVWVPC